MKYLPILFLSLFALTACDEESAQDDITPEAYTLEQEVLAAEILSTLPPDTASESNGTDRRGRRRRAERCFSFVYPVSLITAENETLTFEDKETLREFVKTAEPRRAGTKMVYPFQVTTIDGEVLTFENFRDFRQARRACAGDREPRPRCYKIDFPIEVIVDGETVTVGRARQLRHVFTRRGDSTEASIVYPIMVEEIATGTTLTIEDREGLRELRQNCRE